jgi:porin
MELNKHTVRLFAVVVFLLAVAAHAQTGPTAQPKNAASEAPKPPATPDGNGQTPPPSDPATHLRADLNHDGVAESQLQIEKSETVGPQSEGSADEKLGEPWPWAQNAMLGDLFGARSGLQNAGITFQGSATLDFINVLSGAPVNGFSMVSLLDANLSGDTERMFGLKGGELFLDFQSAAQTRQLSELVPDYWGFDAINSYGSFTELSQYWYQQEIIGDRLMVKFGKIDSNVDFAVPCTGTNFLNSAAYFPGALVVHMPTFPLQAGGVEILTKPFEHFDARVGFFDGSNNYINRTTGATGVNTGSHGLGSFLWDNPGSYFLIAEAGPDWTIGGHKGKFRAGWFEQFGDTQISGVNGNGVGNGPAGTYAYANQQLFNEDPEGLQGLEVFGQFSWSDPNQNSTQWSMMLGSQWQGLIDVRPNDTVGLLWAFNQFSGNDTLTTAPGSSETILETFYNVQVTPWFLIQPDMQYISQPSPDSTQNIPGAFVFTMRLTFVF